jgi:hypothetical protein
LKIDLKKLRPTRKILVPKKELAGKDALLSWSALEVAIEKAPHKQIQILLKSLRRRNNFANFRNDYISRTNVNAKKRVLSKSFKIGYMLHYAISKTTAQYAE